MPTDATPAASVTDRAGTDDAANWRPGEEPDDVGAGEFVAALLAPGSSTWRRHRVIAVGLLVAGVAFPLVALAVVAVRATDPLSAALDGSLLALLASAMVVGVLARAVAVGEVALARRDMGGPLGAAPFVAALGLVLVAVPLIWVTSTLLEARSVVAEVFADGTDVPIHDPAGASPTGGATAAPTTNILVIAGERVGDGFAVRADTFVLVVTDTTSGRTSLVGIDADLADLDAPAGSPLAEWLDGFDGSLGDVPAAVSADEAIAGELRSRGRQPGAAAAAEVVAASLDVRVDDYVLVDTAGVAEVVDAIGDVEVELAAGDVVALDGAAALAFIALQAGDDGESRLDRQMELIEGIGDRLSPARAVTSFSDTASAIGDSVRTSLGTDEFADLTDLLADGDLVSERALSDDGGGESTREELTRLVDEVVAELVGS